MINKNETRFIVEDEAGNRYVHTKVGKNLDWHDTWLALNEAGLNEIILLDHDLGFEEIQKRYIKHAFSETVDATVNWYS